MSTNRHTLRSIVCNNGSHLLLMSTVDSAQLCSASLQFEVDARATPYRAISNDIDHKLSHLPFAALASDYCLLIYFLPSSSLTYQFSYFPLLLLFEIIISHWTSFEFSGFCLFLFIPFYLLYFYKLPLKVSTRFLIVEKLHPKEKSILCKSYHYTSRQLSSPQFSFRWFFCFFSSVSFCVVVRKRAKQNIH